jgi:hypothetical protein
MTQDELLVLIYKKRRKSIYTSMICIQKSIFSDQRSSKK